MLITFILIGAGVCAGAYLLVPCYRRASVAKSVIKTLSVALLAVAAWIGGGPGALVAALGLCALGDFLLSRDGEAAFIGGVGAFAAGHLAYVWLFLSTPGADTSRLGEPWAMASIIGLGMFGVVMMVVLFRNAGELRFAVLGYVPVILSMAVAAMMVAPEGSLQWVLWSAISFVISDTVLAAEMFLLPVGAAMRRVTPFVIWGFYWLAQFGFFVSYGWA